jgi:hypothetical protein
MNHTLPDRMLDLMSDGSWHPADELVQTVSHRFSATLHVLTKRGHTFEKRQVAHNKYEYRLIIDRVSVV